MAVRVVAQVALGSALGAKGLRHGVELRAVLVPRADWDRLHLLLQQRVRAAVEVPVESQVEKVLVERGEDVRGDPWRKVRGARRILRVDRRGHADNACEGEIHLKLTVRVELVSDAIVVVAYGEPAGNYQPAVAPHEGARAAAVPVPPEKSRRN